LEILDVTGHILLSGEDNLAVPVNHKYVIGHHPLKEEASK
jgi:hypothetical protein